MSEIRKDYFTNKLVIIPNVKDSGNNSSKFDNKKINCPLCPGNEHMLNPADLILIQKGQTLIKITDEEVTNRTKNWNVKIVKEKKPIVSNKPNNVFSNEPLYNEPGNGEHYRVIATPEHNKTLGNIEVSQLVDNLSIIQDKIRWLYRQKHISYVILSVSYGSRSGAFTSHLYFDIIAIPRIPPVIDEEAKTFQKEFNEMGVCPMCKIINLEQDSKRKIISTENYIAFCPWASSYPYEFWIFPIKHETSFLILTQKELQDLATIIRSTIGGLEKISRDCSYNLIFHMSSEKKSTKQIHWHIEVYPRMQHEDVLGSRTDIYVNNTLPEEAAQILSKNSTDVLAKLVGIDI